MLSILLIILTAGSLEAPANPPAPTESNHAAVEQHRKDVEELTRAFRRRRPDVSEEVVRRVQLWVASHPTDGESLFLVARPSLVLGTRAGAHADDRAIERLEAAAATGYAPAIAALGWAKVQGEEVTEDVTEGMALVRKAVEAGDPEAHLVLGGILLDGDDGRPPARDEAMKHLEVAYKGGAVRAGTILWNAYDAADQGGEHLDLLREAAEQGDPLAQICLCKCYSEAKYVPQDPAAAERWGRLAAVSGVPSYQCFLGQFYLRLGIGAESEARHWLKLAIDGGEERARYLLAMCYLDDVNSTDADIERGLTLLRRAAEAGQPDAEETLAGFYFEGMFFARDLKEARRWYKSAATHGSGTAEGMLRWIDLAQKGQSEGEPDSDRPREPGF